MIEEADRIAKKTTLPGEKRRQKTKQLYEQMKSKDTASKLLKKNLSKKPLKVTKEYNFNQGADGYEQAVADSLMRKRIQNI